MNCELIQRITNYLAAGGLVNPELMEHEKVRDLLIDCFDELAKPEPQVCCGDYEKCWKACTPRGRWLAEKELVKPEQTKYSDIVSDGGLDPRNKFDAQPEQEQEPVAWLVSDAQGRYATIRDPSLYKEEVYEPLYAAPPRKPWQGLTAEKIFEITERLTKEGGVNCDGWIVAVEVQQKLKEKNT